MTEVEPHLTSGKTPSETMQSPVEIEQAGFLRLLFSVRLLLLITEDSPNRMCY